MRERGERGRGRGKRKRETIFIIVKVPHALILCDFVR